jgi:hypothetical protein
MGLMLVAAAAVGLLLGAPTQDAARYLESRQADDGGFAEPGRQATPGLTAWVVLGLKAAGRTEGLDAAAAYLERAEPELATVTDVELALTAQAALGRRPAGLVARVRAAVRASGAIGPTINSTVWGIIALRAAGEPAPPRTVRYLLSRQTRTGGWSWAAGAAPDSNDTAAAVQALRAAGVGGAPITRALAYLRRLQNRDGGFELADGRGSDVQSTAWAIQAFLAAGRRPGQGAYRYLARMRRADGSYRYSSRYTATPVWVTAQALTALAGKPLPLRE